VTRLRKACLLGAIVYFALGTYAAWHTWTTFAPLWHIRPVEQLVQRIESTSDINEAKRLAVPVITAGAEALSGTAALVKRLVLVMLVATFGTSGLFFLFFCIRGEKEV
jgi:type IV secretory pathway VirB2 component (pilin)